MPYPIPVSFDGKDGLILLDQIRTLDKKRLVKRLGEVVDKRLSDTLLALYPVEGCVLTKQRTIVFEQDLGDQ